MTHEEASDTGFGCILLACSMMCGGLGLCIGFFIWGVR